MRVYLLIIVLLYFESGVTRAQTISYSSSEQELVREVEIIKQTINVESEGYKRTEGKMSSSGYQYVYSKHKEVKVVSLHFNDMDPEVNYVQEFYFDKGLIVYAEQYTVRKIAEHILDIEKMYFKDEKLAVWVQLGEKISSNSKKFKEYSEEASERILKFKAGNFNLK